MKVQTDNVEGENDKEEERFRKIRLPEYDLSAGPKKEKSLCRIDSDEGSLS